ncbi:hypothetical protein [Caudoviricetes sp.]|nr:hypothetical protein [Caudoviricetes sp.]
MDLLIINDRPISQETQVTVSQTLAPMALGVVHRMQDGSVRTQRNAVGSKLTTNISVAGWCADGLGDFDALTPFDVACIQRLSIRSTSNIIVLPHTYRVDTGYSPQGAAVVDGRLITSAIAMDGQEATITTVGGATAYEVMYYPIITFVSSTGIQRSDDLTNNFSWTLQAEQT